MNYTILIAEDDEDIINLLKLYLVNEGFVVLTANDGIRAYEFIETNKIDLALIDIMMPKMDGYELTKKIRTKYNIPIIILSARNLDSDKIIGLNIGADDYITKPFNPLEIVARINSNLRRFYNLNSNNTAPTSANRLIVGDLVLDTDKLTLMKNDKEIIITPTEFKILSVLMNTPGRVYTKSQIYEKIKGEYYENDENTLMVHVSKLREKIEDNPKKPQYIRTIRGIGYKIDKK